MVVNTSFNDNEEPIVCTPEDAIRCYPQDRPGRAGPRPVLDGEVVTARDRSPLDGSPAGLARSVVLRAAAGATLLIMVVLPADRHHRQPGRVSCSRSRPVVFAVLAIGGFPQRPAARDVLLVLVCVGYMGVVDTLYIMQVLAFAEAADQDAAFPSSTRSTFFVNAFTVLAVLFGYRLGGATTGACCGWASPASWCWSPASTT